MVSLEMGSLGLKNAVTTPSPHSVGIMVSIEMGSLGLKNAVTTQSPHNECCKMLQTIEVFSITVPSAKSRPFRMSRTP